MRLGRLAANPADLMAARRHDTLGAFVAPSVLDRSAISFMPGLYRNDTLADCTVVSIANMITARAALNGFQVYIDPDKVVEFFAAAAGNPANLETIPGLVYLDVLKRQETSGFDTGHDRLYGTSYTINPTRNQIASSMATAGAVGAGVTLTTRDMDTIRSTGQAGVLDAGNDDGEVEGGHAAIFWDYTGLRDDDIVRCGTWGYWQRVTWRWIERRINEAHFTTWPQLAAAPAA